MLPLEKLDYLVSKWAHGKNLTLDLSDPSRCFLVLSGVPYSFSVDEETAPEIKSNLSMKIKVKFFHLEQSGHFISSLRLPKAVHEQQHVVVVIASGEIRDPQPLH